MRTALTLSAALVLVACGGDSPESSSASIGVKSGRPIATVAETPAATIAAAVQHLQSGSVSSFLLTMAPPAELEEMKTQWAAMRTKPITEAEDAQFKELMSRLTAKGAESALFAEIQPHLAEAQQQLGMIAGMAPMMAAGAIQESGAPQDTLVMVETLGQKIAQMNIASEDKAKEAIAIVCRAARKIDVASGAALQKLSFDQALGKVDLAYGAIMDALAVYGIDFTSTFESIAVETLSASDDRAELEITMSLFGLEPQTIPVEMERIDGRWFGRKANSNANTPSAAR